MKRFFSLLYFFLFYFAWFLVALLSLMAILLQVKNIRRWLHRRNPDKSLHVLYLSLHGKGSAGTTYREEKWAEIFRQHGFRVKVKSVFTNQQFFRFTHSDFGRFKLFAGFLFARIFQCLQSIHYDVVIVRRELLFFNDYGNLFLEKFMHALHPAIVLDFDDDLIAAKNEPFPLTTYGRLLFEHPRKWSASLKYYTHFIPGTRYLADLMLQYRPVPESHLCIMPTCVDYEKYPVHDYTKPHPRLVFGWAGGRYNLNCLDMVVDALNRIQEDFPLELLVISNSPYSHPEAKFEIVNLTWTAEQEIENLQRMDIGLMPLPDTTEQRGKCGFKLIQYMGCGLVSVSSAITFNNEVVDDGINGWLVYEERDWEQVLRKALSHRAEFGTIGQKAFLKVKENFTFAANQQRYMQFLQDVYSGKS